MYLDGGSVGRLLLENLHTLRWKSTALWSCIGGIPLKNVYGNTYYPLKTLENP